MSQEEIKAADNVPNPALDELRKLLDAGDIQGATLFLAAKRSELLQSQELERLNNDFAARNAELVRLNGELQKTTDMDRRAELRSEIDKLNEISQLDMLRLQGLMTKHNQMFDMMTNLLDKQQRTMDQIVRNMR